VFLLLIYAFLIAALTLGINPVKATIPELNIKQLLGCPILIIVFIRGRSQTTQL